MVQTANRKSGDPLNYQLPGRVSLFFRKRGSTDRADWQEFGNVISPVLVPNIERLPHHSMRRGVRAKDRELISTRGGSLNFSIDEINLPNLKFMFGTDKAAVDKIIELNDGKIENNPGGTAPDNTIDLNVQDIIPGSVVVRTAHEEEVDEVTFLTPADYTVDSSTGILTITPGGDLANNDPETAGGVDQIHVFFQKDAEAQVIEIFSGDEIEGEGRFQVLTKKGAQYVFDFGNVSIRTNGDFSIGDGTTWQEVPLSMELLEDNKGIIGLCALIKEDELD